MRHRGFPLRFFSTSVLALCLLLVAPAIGSASSSVEVVVWKRRHELWLVRDGKAVRRYPISLGLAGSAGYKELRGDRKTPVGRYYVCEKHPSTLFRRFLALSYPAVEDAERALHAGLISVDTWADVWLASKLHHKPPWDTPLGGFVGIHGTGADGPQGRLREANDWTDGCIALRDRDVEELYDLVPVGTAVDIRD